MVCRYLLIQGYAWNEISHIIEEAEPAILEKFTCALSPEVRP